MCMALLYVDMEILTLNTSFESTLQSEKSVFRASHKGSETSRSLGDRERQR